MQSLRVLIALLGAAFVLAAAPAAVPLSHEEASFAHPPDSARPWVIWFWMDGNVSREGITADLEAMARVGIGGALLMDVTQEIPAGPVRFNGPEWHEMFRHAAAEAHRLGLELALNNAPGWSGSGGPWIKPEFAMQKVAWSRTVVVGPAHFEGPLAAIQTVRGYLEPIATLAFPEKGTGQSFRIPLPQAKAGMSRAGTVPGKPISAGLLKQAAAAAARLADMVDLTSRTDPQGRLTWEVPPGKWTVLRFGATLTGMENHPVREGGQGFECDKLSGQAVEAHFRAFLEPLIKEAGLASGGAIPPAGGLDAIHIDSWEIGFQNWTPRFREEFSKQRGYDLLKYLPAYTGQVVGSLEISERFLWDVRRTIADLEADHYAGRLAELAHERGLRLSIEAYGNGPFDNLLYGSRADLPMGEFWTETEDYSRFHSCKSMASAAHVYGRAVVAAEAFTSYPPTARWQNHPGSLKALADAAFCQGINRLVIHRYAHQPWLHREPGMTMGRFGVHYERTETWWEQSKPWHEYLARCQYLLQSGQFAADVCYLSDEGAYCEPLTRQKLQPPLPDGYDYDIATPEAVLTRMSVKDGFLRLPDGVHYRVLVLPRTGRMTPQLLSRLQDLVAAGAVIAGPKPTNSPSLSQYPACDEMVQKIAALLWPEQRGPTNQGPAAQRIVQNVPLAQLLAEMKIAPDFKQLTPTTGFPLSWIHRTVDGAEIYFVANSNAQPIRADCAFRVAGKRPELWHPDTGHIEKIASWEAREGQTRLPLALDGSGSCFVVFREPVAGFEPVVKLERNGRPEGDASLALNQAGRLELTAAKAGTYECTAASGRKWRAEVGPLPKPLAIFGPWELQFPPGHGAPERVILPQLDSWSRLKEFGVKYFSGQATYRKTVKLGPEFFGGGRRLRLRLGRVEVLAQIRLNGRDLGILWKPPFELDVTENARAGENELEIKVTNLWPNRLIGDEFLPEDCEWTPMDPVYGAALAAWPKWLLEGKPSPTGRLAFSTWKFYRKDSPLLESGLIGPVTFQAAERIGMR